MFHNMVKKITDYMIEKNIIEEEMFDIYQYGFELMISSTITMLSIMIIACIMDSPLIGILYFFITVPLKVTAGGYHAPTYAKCFIISQSTFRLFYTLLRLDYSIDDKHRLYFVKLPC